MTRNGKIARLPVAIREELNRRLENGEAGVRLIEWLNGLPEVKAVLAVEFEGVPISDMNLSQWKNGGFLDWQARQRAQEAIERWQTESPKSKVQSPKSEDGAAESPMSNGASRTGVQCPMSEEVAEALTERLMVHYAAALEDAIAESDEKPRNRVERLGRSLRDMVRVRHYDLARDRAAAEQERVKMERERLELLREKLNRQPAGSTQAREANMPGAEQKPAISHEQKAEMVRKMLEEL